MLGIERLHTLYLPAGSIVFVAKNFPLSLLVVLDAPNCACLEAWIEFFVDVAPKTIKT